MSNDYGNDNDYWDDKYYYENYDKDLDPNSWSGHTGSKSGYGGLIWFIALIVICNLSTDLGAFFIAGSIIYWIVRRFRR